MLCCKQSSDFLTEDILELELSGSNKEMAALHSDHYTHAGSTMYYYISRYEYCIVYRHIY